MRAGRQAGQADRRAGKRWAGHLLGFFAAGYLFTLYVPEYGFTTAGVMVAMAVVAQAWFGTRAERAAD